MIDYDDDVFNAVQIECPECGFMHCMEYEECWLCGAMINPEYQPNDSHRDYTVDVYECNTEWLDIYNTEKLEDEY